MGAHHVSVLPSVDADGLGRLAGSLGGSSEILDVMRLFGGLEAETSAFWFGARRLVMKRFPAGSELRACVEFENLSVVASVAVETPEPVFLDATGACLGTPTVVMTALPGRPAFYWRDVERSTRGAAYALAAIHAVGSEQARAVVIPRWRRWRAPIERLGAGSGLAQVALDRLYASAERAAVVFSHDDYNPGNVLFDDGRLTGVVDWGEITREPREAAVALYRHMLWIHPGGSAPDQFLAHYKAATAAALPEVPIWDVLYGLRGIGSLKHWAKAFQEHGLPITEQEINSKSITWIERALAAAGL